MKALPKESDDSTYNVNASVMTLLQKLTAKSELGWQWTGIKLRIIDKKGFYLHDVKS